MCLQYGLEDPLSMLKRDPPQKSVFKNYINTRITAFHENEQRCRALKSYKLKYFNVSLLGLSGRPHPALSNLICTNEVKKSGFHLKMLICDLYTYEVKSEHSGVSAHCRACYAVNPESDISTHPSESICHILTICCAYSDIRARFTEEYSQLCLLSTSGVNFNDITCDSELLCQFILDPSSINLPTRVNINDPLLGSFFQLSRDLCYAINTRRLKLLQDMDSK